MISINEGNGRKHDEEIKLEQLLDIGPKFYTYYDTFCEKYDGGALVERYHCSTKQCNCLAGAKGWRCKHILYLKRDFVGFGEALAEDVIEYLEQFSDVGDFAADAPDKIAFAHFKCNFLEFELAVFECRVSSGKFILALDRI